MRGIREAVTNVSHEEGFISNLFSEMKQEYVFLYAGNCKFDVCVTVHL